MVENSGNTCKFIDFTCMLNKGIFLLLISLLFCGKIYSQNRNSPRSYVAYKAIDPIEIDGKADEKSWQLSSKSESFVDIEGEEEPRYNTFVKMLWDEQFLYFYARMEEPHIWATLKQRDTVIFYNNDFEIFIDPDGDTHNYYEFEMNALNTVWDLFLVKPYRESGPVIDSWDIQGLKSAVYIDGSLNNPADEDNFWSVEVAIPWEVLKEANSHGRLPENEFWRINFSRVNWDYKLQNGTYSRKKDESGEFLAEYNWVWSPQYVINMHEPERWGYVYFSAKPVGEEEKFGIPQDEKVKWLLYDLYKAQKSFQRKNNKWATSIKQLHKEELQLDNHKIAPVIEIHKSGWNILITSPFTGKTFLIREDGKFVEHNTF